jgi:hypothetical protein
MVGYRWWQRSPFCVALGLMWRGHIGMDRVLAFGLKYSDQFQHTHLWPVEKQVPTDVKERVRERGRGEEGH